MKNSISEGSESDPFSINIIRIKVESGQLGNTWEFKLSFLVAYPMDMVKGSLFLSSRFHFFSLREAYIPNVDPLLCLEPFQK